MTTGFAGHNSGKKFIKGVGYVTPEKESKPRVCKNCGTVEPKRMRYFASGKTDCINCAPEFYDDEEAA